mgnify:FL=1
MCENNIMSCLDLIAQSAYNLDSCKSRYPDGFLRPKYIILITVHLLNTLTLAGALSAPSNINCH